MRELLDCIEQIAVEGATRRIARDPERLRFLTRGAPSVVDSRTRAAS
jgi:hypothetical protein